ncbi:TPA: hypothetical protein DCZ15_03520 [Candidatus Falkowbacteria bacterium]|nr:MAG: hypothetical protein UV95_C0002G0091 [Candidatus Falkowbacteria bacterium GW2011_GWF2_43_32]HBA36917.1 hypothetical protein [Candidatus Falkowbacteria bacterium]
MFPIDYKKISVLFVGFLVVELLSFWALSWPMLNYIAVAVILAIALAASLYRLEYGLLIVAGELFIGSLGHLFQFNIGSTAVTIRVALWLIVMSAFLLKFIAQIVKYRRQSLYWSRWRNFFSGHLLAGGKLFWLLFLFIVIGLINGWARGHALTTIFLDFNAWLYFLLLFPIVAVYGEREAGRIKRLQTLFFAAAFCLSLKTLFLLYIFTHNLGVADVFYVWLRRTLVGEMTPTLSGWPRIFIQGQIFSALAFLMVFWLRQFDRVRWQFRDFFQTRNMVALLIAGLFFSSILISFSRSFWVGFLAAAGASLILLWRRTSFLKTVRAGGWLILAGGLGFLLIYLTAVFPYPRAGGFSADFEERISNQNEAALASRWSLLPVLGEEIKKEPWFGQGFGATVTYFSRDPRILENNPSGEYTTYAFEWGYLDIWLKLGCLGLLAYLWLLFRLSLSAWRQGVRHNDYLFFSLIAGIIFLAVTNIFTPYLNHPLGIGFLLFSSCLIWPDRVY